MFDPDFTTFPVSALTMRYSTKNIFELLIRSEKSPEGKKHTGVLVD